MDDIRCYRPLIIGRRGAVAANHPLAAQAGLLALRAGGNAVDAAVATALTLAVVEPMMSGLGGDGFYNVFDAASGRAVVFNGTGPAPRAATPERYAAGIPRTGPMSVSVPGLVAGLGMMHRDYGRLPWRDLFAEAIHYARDGFGATPHYRHFAGEHLACLRADRRSAAVFLQDGDGAAASATPIVQPDLARTLEEIAAEGAESFYRGALARRLAAACAEAGVPVAEADLAEFEAERQEPIAHRLSRPDGARSAAELDRLRAAAGAEDRREFRPRRRWVSARPISVHVMVEAKKLAFADRERWGADPRSIDAPLDELLSAEYAARLAAPDRPAAGRADPRHRRRGRQHDLFLHRRRRRQRGLRHPEHQQRLGLRRDRRRHRHPAEQPHGLLAPRPGAPEPPAARPARAPHDEPAAGAEGRRAVGGVRHARRRQPGADQLPGADRDDRFRPRPAAGRRDAALDLERARAIRELSA